MIEMGVSLDRGEERGVKLKWEVGLQILAGALKVTIMQRIS
jgi:hypothetical protein